MFYSVLLKECTHIYLIHGSIEHLVLQICTPHIDQDPSELDQSSEFTIDPAGSHSCSAVKLCIDQLQQDTSGPTAPSSLIQIFSIHSHLRPWPNDPLICGHTRGTISAFQFIYHPIPTCT